MESNYKSKYLALRLKFMESVDQAFRLGYEQGMQDAQLDQMAQQQQAQEAAMQGGDPNDPNAEPGEEGQDPNDPNAQAQGQEGTELDQHINNLQQAVGGADGKAKEEVQKALNGLIAFKAKRDLTIELKKSDKAAKSIAKALKPRLSLGAKNNLSKNAHKSLNMQEKIVADVMKAWEKESEPTAQAITQILNIDNLVKKD